MRKETNDKLTRWEKINFYVAMATSTTMIVLFLAAILMGVIGVIMKFFA